MRQFIAAFFLLLPLTMITGCASTKGDLNHSRPEFTTQITVEKHQFVVESRFHQTENVVATISSLKLQGGEINLDTRPVGGRVGGGSYLYAIDVPRDQIETLGSEALVTVSALMTDNGAVVRCYYVKRNLLKELNPLKREEELEVARKTYRDF